jgi:spore coat protein U-like protein
MKKLLLLLLVVGMVFAFSTIAHSGAVKDYMLVTATAVEVCEISTFPISFGNYEYEKIDITGQSVFVKCNEGRNYRISMNEGLHPDGCKRRMKGPKADDYLTYYIFKGGTDALWGDQNEGGCAGSGNSLGSLVGTGSVQPHDARAIVVGDQTEAGLGKYWDKVRVTVHY